MSGESTYGRSPSSVTVTAGYGREGEGKGNGKKMGVKVRDGEENGSERK